MKQVIAIACAILMTGHVQAKLEVMNIEAAYGVLGPERKSLDFHPLDEVLFRYQVLGAKTDADGKTDCEVTVKLANVDGKTVFERKTNIRRPLSLGGNTFPGFAVLHAPKKAPPGEYTLSVDIHDRIAKESTNFERKLTCKPAIFQMLAFRFWRDDEGKMPAPAGGLVGETIHLKLRVVGFDKNSKKIRTTLTVAILDDAGKPIGDKPQVIKAEVSDPIKAASASEVDYASELYLNRPGTFTLRLTAEDLEGKQTATWETPLKVAGP